MGFEKAKQIDYIAAEQGSRVDAMRRIFHGADPNMEFYCSKEPIRKSIGLIDA